MSNELDELTRLRAEVARLIALLESHGIDWRLPPALTTASTPPPPEPSNLSTAEKVALFRRLFRGRIDVHPVRWESATTGKSGYAPACANEWRPGICEKPRIKCADCGNRSLIPVSDAVIYSHLAGEKTMGVYPLLPADTCYFLAVDFDKAEWREDGRKVLVLTERIDDLDRIRRSLEEHTLGALAELLRPTHTPIEDLLAKHLPGMTEKPVDPAELDPVRTQFRRSGRMGSHTMGAAQHSTDGCSQPLENIKLFRPYVRPLTPSNYG